MTVSPGLWWEVPTRAPSRATCHKGHLGVCWRVRAREARQLRRDTRHSPLPQGGALLFSEPQSCSQAGQAHFTVSMVMQEPLALPRLVP